MTTQQQIRSLQREVEDLKELLSDKVESKINGHLPFSADELKDMARETGRNLKGYFRTKGRQAIVVKEAAEDTIRERPITVTALAFAAGAVLAALFSRRD